jgi:L,D-transpeptidase ErfK/SrfK
MYPEDAEELFDLVEVGTKVAVVDQPIKLGWIEGQLFIEAHPNQQQSDQLEANGTFDSELPSGVVDQALTAAADEASRLDWSRIRQATLERRGYPVRITNGLTSSRPAGFP